jgi:hypothetical protein
MNKNIYATLVGTILVFFNAAPASSVQDAPADSAVNAPADSAVTDLKRYKELGNWVHTHLVKEVDVYQGQLFVAAVPSFADPSKQLIDRMRVFVRNSSPRGYRFLFAVRCGEWSKSVSGSIEGVMPEAQVLKVKRDFSFDVTPQCKLTESSLEEIKEAEGTSGPEPKSSQVPGVDDGELLRRLKFLKDRTASQQGPSIWNKVDEACKQPSVAELANAPTSTIGKNMTACAKAADEARATMTASKAALDTDQRTSSTQGALLAVTAANEYYDSLGSRHLEGEVRNISGQSLNAVWAVVSYYTAAGEYVRSDTAPIEFQPILPHQTSPFHIVGPENPAITRWKLQFKIFGGGTVPSEFRQVPR